MNALDRPKRAEGILIAYGRVIDGAMQLVGFRPASGLGGLYRVIALGLIPPIMEILLFRKYVLKGRKK